MRRQVNRAGVLVALGLLGLCVFHAWRGRAAPAVPGAAALAVAAVPPAVSAAVLAAPAPRPGRPATAEPASLRKLTSAPGAPVAAAQPQADRCARTRYHRPEPVQVPGLARPAPDPDADASDPSTASPAHLKEYLAEHDLALEPRIRRVAVSTALWFVRELRAEVADDLRTEARDRARGLTGGLPSRAPELTEQLRHLDALVEAARAAVAETGRPALACDDPQVQKAALCKAYQTLRVAPEGSAVEAVDRVCASVEQRAVAGLVRLDDRARWYERAPHALVRLAYDLDRQHLLVRSTELCLGSARYRPYVEEKLEEAPPAEQARAEALLDASNEAGAELGDAGLEPLRCDEPEVQAALGCLVRASVLGPVGPGCQEPRVRALVARVRRDQEARPGRGR